MSKFFFDIQRFVLNGTARADNLNNTLDGNVVNGLAGNDTITSSASSSTLNGGAGNDYIFISGNSNNVVNGGAGNDVVSVSGSSGSLMYQFAYGHGNDVVYGAGSILNRYVSLAAGTYYQTLKSGNDLLIRAYNRNGAASGGAIAFKNAASVQLIGGAFGGRNYGEVTVSSSSGSYGYTSDYADMVTISAANVNFWTRGGDDNVINNGQSARISLGNGSDYIINNGASSTILGQAGADALYTNTKNSYADMGAGNDSVYGTSETSSTILGGAGNDLLAGAYTSSYLNGGAGNDVVSLIGGGASNTINGGAGNDRIYASGNSNAKIYDYAYGGGHDTVYGASSKDTLHLVSGAYQSVMSGSDLVVRIGQNGTFNGSVTFKDTQSLAIDGQQQIINKKAGALFEGDSNDNAMFNGGARATVYGLNGNDSIVNQGVSAQVYAGNGNDTIQNLAAGRLSTLDAGEGDDLIKGAFINTSIVGGAGNDVISVNGGAAGNKINAGKGNDTIYTGLNTAAKVIQYANGDGNDIIYGYTPASTINITSGAYTTSTVAGSKDITVNITSGANSTVSTGTITLKNAVGKNINITGTKVTESATPQEVIKRFMFALDYTTQSGVAALNQAVNVASNGYFKSAAAVINAMVKDRNAAGSGSAFLTNYCGINLSNTDTGAITGSDAGGSTAKTNESIVPESGSLTSSTYYTSDSFKIGDVTFKLSSNYSNLTNPQKFIWSALQKWWAPNSLSLISDSYGSHYDLVAEKYGLTNLTALNNNNNTIAIKFVNQNSSFLAQAWNSSYSNGVGYPFRVDFNMKYYPSIDTTNYNGYDSVKKQTYLDRVFAHELTHSVMSGHIRYFNKLPAYIKEGVAELTHGIDDQRGSDITALANNVTKLRQALGNNVSTFKVAGIGAPQYAGGYMFLRYLAKQGSAHYGQTVSANAANVDSNAITTEGSVLTVNPTFKEKTVDLSEYSSKIKKVDASKLTNDIMIIGNEKANSIKGGAGNDTISGNSGNDTLIGGAGNDEIYGDGGNNLLKGGSGKDTLFGAGNDTFVGGGGKDTFVYVGGTIGNAVITDYTEKDKIEINGYAVSDTVYSGQDVVFKIGESTLTVKDGKGKNINVTNTTENYAATLEEGSGDIFGEDNFISQDATIADISQITDGGFSEYNLGNIDYTSLAQNDKTALAYSGTN